MRYARFGNVSVHGDKAARVTITRCQYDLTDPLQLSQPAGCYRMSAPGNADVPVGRNKGNAGGSSERADEDVGVPRSFP